MLCTKVGNTVLIVAELAKVCACTSLPPPTHSAFQEYPYQVSRPSFRFARQVFYTNNSLCLATTTSSLTTYQPLSQAGRLLRPNHSLRCIAQVTLQIVQTHRFSHRQSLHVCSIPVPLKLMIARFVQPQPLGMARLYQSDWTSISEFQSYGVT
jgi:hypothetical protein